MYEPNLNKFLTLLKAKSVKQRKMHSKIFQMFSEIWTEFHYFLRVAACVRELDAHIVSSQIPFSVLTLY